MAGEVYSMTKTMTPDHGKYDPGKLNDDTDSMTTLNYNVPSLDLAKWLQWSPEVNDISDE